MIELNWKEEGVENEEVKEEGERNEKERKRDKEGKSVSKKVETGWTFTSIYIQKKTNTKWADAKTLGTRNYTNDARTKLTLSTLIM